MTSELYAKPQFLDLEESKLRCLENHLESKEIYMNDFHWELTLLEMEDLFLSVYETGRRLPLHSHFDVETGEFLLFKVTSQGTKTLNMSPDFIANVASQIEVALEKGFADYVFFPDMGHAHLYFPANHWQAEYNQFNFSSANQHKLYAKMLSDTKMRPLYHLAEQLQLVDKKTNQVLEDDILNFKYWHRNFVGFNDGSENYDIYIAPPTQNFNTVTSIDEHQSWSAGFSVHANSKGCFAYKDKEGVKRYFDISLEDVKYDPKSQSANDLYSTSFESHHEKI